MNKIISITCLLSLLLSSLISHSECNPQNEATYREQIIGTSKELGKKILNTPLAKTVTTL